MNKKLSVQLLTLDFLLEWNKLVILATKANIYTVTEIQQMKRNAKDLSSDNTATSSLMDFLCPFSFFFV